MSEFNVTVDTWEFRAALASVMPHLDSSADPDPLLCRIRAYVTPDGVVLVATDRFTLAMATSSVVDTTGELGCFDFGPVDAREILSLFRPPKDADSPQLKLEHDGNRFRITDASGMFEGKSLKLDGFAAAENYPDVANIIERAAFAARMDVEMTGGLGRVQVGSHGRYVVNPIHLARFVAAGKSYAVELAIEPAGNPPALLVRCSADFAGVMLPRRLTDAQVAMWRSSLQNLPELTRQVSKVHPIAPAVRAHRDSTEVQDLSDLIPTTDEEDDDAS